MPPIMRRMRALTTSDFFEARFGPSTAMLYSVFGMMIAITNEYWEDTFASLTHKQMAKKLLWLARKLNCERFLTNPYGPQKRRKKRRMTTRGGNVSTQRIILQRQLAKT